MRPIGNETGVAINSPCAVWRVFPLSTENVSGGRGQPDPARREELFRQLAQPFQLSRGIHASPEAGMCATELAAFLAGEPHSYRPSCVSQTITNFVWLLGDRTDDDIRQRLLPFVPRLVGTATRQHEVARVEHFSWAAIRVFAPAALRAQGYRRHALELQNSKDFEQAGKIAKSIRDALIGTEAGSPAHLAANSAYRAAASADEIIRRGRLSLRDAHSLPGHASASAAEQAHKAGAAGWDLALDALDVGLDIGVPRGR